MRLSCSTRCIPDYPFEQALKAIAAAGYGYLETCTYDTGAVLDPTIIHTVALKDQFAHHRVALSSLNVTPIAPAAMPETAQADVVFRREAVMARELWLDTLNVSLGPAAACPREAVVAVLRCLADYSATLGFSLALANAPETHAATADDVERLIDETDRPNVGVMLDLVRFHLAGEDVGAAVDRLAARTLVVRTGDVAQGRWVPVGTGEVDNQRHLGRLAEAGYVGFVVVELRIPARAEAERMIAEAHDRLAPLVAEPPMEPIITPRTPTGFTPPPATR